MYHQFDGSSGGAGTGLHGEPLQNQQQQTQDFPIHTGSNSAIHMNNNNNNWQNQINIAAAGAAAGGTFNFTGGAAGVQLGLPGNEMITSSNNFNNNYLISNNQEMMMGSNINTLKVGNDGGRLGLMVNSASSLRRQDASSKLFNPLMQLKRQNASSKLIIPSPAPVPNNNSSNSNSVMNVVQSLPTRLNNMLSSGSKSRKPNYDFPRDYTPGNLDVCCGRGKRNWNHTGNVYFRKLIQANVSRYVDAKSKHDKTEVVKSLVEELRMKGSNFLKQNKTGQWYDIGDAQARDKVGHSLRDQVTALSRKGAVLKQQKDQHLAEQDLLEEQRKHVFRRSSHTSDGDEELEDLRRSAKRHDEHGTFERRPSWLAHLSNSQTDRNRRASVMVNEPLPGQQMSMAEAAAFVAAEHDGLAAEETQNDSRFLDNFDFALDKSNSFNSRRLMNMPSVNSLASNNAPSMRSFASQDLCNEIKQFEFELMNSCSSLVQQPSASSIMQQPSSTSLK